MLTPEEIQKNYQAMNDSQLLNLAKNPYGLRKEVVAILNEELAKRGFDSYLQEIVTKTTDYFEGTEKALLKEYIFQTTCTQCSVKKGVKGYSFSHITSFILGNETKYYNSFLCDSCANKERVKTLWRTLLLGWWSIGGLVFTPYRLGRIIQRFIFKHIDDENIFNEFIKECIVQLRTIRYKKPQELQELIKLYNETSKSVSYSK